jgi:hypothetical protein
MKTLNLTAMENIQGGAAGSFGISLPLTAVLGALGLGNILGIGLGLGLVISYDLNLPALPLGL